jgi:23S rRNA U2552 (ribose-2'-O)-methylase RlmE/FtsJ
MLSYFLNDETFLKTHQLNNKNWRVSHNNNIPSILLSHSLEYFLRLNKAEMEHNTEMWDICKRFTNPYEYIHTNVSQHRLNVSALSPVSRSFYKLVEMLQYYRVLDNIYFQNDLSTFHLAEGPGGFVEAIYFLRNKLRSTNNDIYEAITLDPKKNCIPSWNKLQRKHFFQIQNKKIHLHYGNLLDPELFEELLCKTSNMNTRHLITADGGIDFSKGFQEQEFSAIPLIIAQVLYAIMLQKKGGIFIVKVFDIFSRPSVEILYLLSYFYEEVSICKPNTSRYANSEKYVVCQKFKFESSLDFKEKFADVLQQLSEKPESAYVHSFLGNILDIPLSFLNEIEEANIIMGKQQMFNINSTLQHVSNKRSEKTYKLSRQNVDKCVQWCKIHGIPIRDTYIPINIFKKKM